MKKTICEEDLINFLKMNAFGADVRIALPFLLFFLVLCGG